MVIIWRAKNGKLHTYLAPSKEARDRFTAELEREGLAWWINGFGWLFNDDSEAI